jgi:redox-sensing transcriptional repressor
MKEVIPRKTVYRLSLYLRCLERLKSNRIQTVSSDTLARAAGVKPTQLRKDLTHFGQFGTRGLGYNVRSLRDKLEETLRRTRLQPVILVGVGNLGSALLGYNGFEKEGFEIVSGFDVDPQKIRLDIRGIPIRPMSQLATFVREADVRMAILCVPGTSAQEITNELCRSGIQAILNFAPIILQVPDSVVVNNVNLAIELENLSYFIKSA